MRPFQIDLPHSKGKRWTSRVLAGARTGTSHPDGPVSAATSLDRKPLLSLRDPCPPVTPTHSPPGRLCTLLPFRVGFLCSISDGPPAHPSTPRSCRWNWALPGHRRFLWTIMRTARVPMQQRRSFCVLPLPSLLALSPSSQGHFGRDHPGLFQEDSNAPWVKPVFIADTGAACQPTCRPHRLPRLPRASGPEPSAALPTAHPVFCPGLAENHLLRTPANREGLGA